MAPLQCSANVALFKRIFESRLKYPETNYPNAQNPKTSLFSKNKDLKILVAC